MTSKAKDSSDATGSQKPVIFPVVEGPITGGSRGYPFASSIGYTEHEYFISGTATRYTPIGNLTADGHWNIVPSSMAAYKTRVLVHRPANPDDFTGTIILEWSNVSLGYEISFGNTQGLYGAGYVYILVSAQAVGITGNEPDPIGLVQWDPVRYGTLSIIDDALSYDIYTQVGKLVAEEKKHITNRVTLLGGLKTCSLIAMGGSQSGARILAYTNGVQPLENVFDITMPLLCAVHASDFSSAPAYANGSAHNRAFNTKVRTDLKTPVWEINSETEALYYYGNRQPDTDKFRYWEVTGSSHANAPVVAAISQKAIRDGVPAPGRSSTTPSNVSNAGRSVSICTCLG
ncbi:hypothetical protein B7463_g1669, partial [Scytalidium lignicola]